MHSNNAFCYWADWLYDYDDIQYKDDDDVDYYDDDGTWENTMFYNSSLVTLFFLLNTTKAVQ